MAICPRSLAKSYRRHRSCRSRRVSVRTSAATQKFRLWFAGSHPLHRAPNDRIDPLIVMDTSAVPDLSLVSVLRRPERPQPTSGPQRRRDRLDAEEHRQRRRNHEPLADALEPLEAEGRVERQGVGFRVGQHADAAQQVALR